MIPHYEDKFSYLVYRPRQYCRCNIAREKSLENKPCEDLHHRLHNTKTNRKLYPLFIHSLLNLEPVNHAYHLAWPSWNTITPYRADKYEKFLERHPKIANFVNNLELT